MPMAGAPRTRKVRMASQTASTVRQSISAELDRQQRLVDQPQMPVDAADPVERFQVLHRVGKSFRDFDAPVA